MKKTRIAIADDSSFMRKVLKRIIESEREMEVVGLAENGKEAIELVKRENPDILLLDIEMPVMDGLVSLTYLMKNNPLPIIIISAYAREKAEYSVLALEQGAVDIIEKPSGSVSMDMESIKEIVISKIRAIRGIDVHKIEKTIQSPSPVLTPLPMSPRGGPLLALVIGASTGGIVALESILPQLPKNFPCSIFVAQHLPAGYTRDMAERLDSLSQLEVCEATQNEVVRMGVIYVAKGSKHMLLHKAEGETRIDIVDYLNDLPVPQAEKKYNFAHYTPSIDALMASVSKIYGANTIGVVLTGMGTDGTVGLKVIHENGGYCMTEAATTALIDGMPLSARESGYCDEVQPLFLMTESILKQVRHKILKSEDVKYGS